MNLWLQRLRPIENGSHTNLQNVQSSVNNSSESRRMVLRERAFSVPNKCALPQLNMISQNVSSLVNTTTVAGISVGLNVARPSEMMAASRRW